MASQIGCKSTQADSQNVGGKGPTSLGTNHGGNRKARGASPPANGKPKIVDLLEGLEQRPETKIQVVQAITQVAMDEGEACAHGQPMRKGDISPEKRSKGKSKREEDHC